MLLTGNDSLEQVFKECGMKIDVKVTKVMVFSKASDFHAQVLQAIHQKN